MTDEVTKEVTPVSNPRRMDRDKVQYRKVEVVPPHAPRDPITFAPLSEQTQLEMAAGREALKRLNGK
jgi:hypothetical protein